jgi:predicted DNA-binding transcriptional regulator AlpA
MSNQVDLPIRDKIVLSMKEAATVTGLSISTLKRNSDLKKTKLSVRRVGVRCDHLEAWLDARVTA